jgi:hypothetical protein
MTPPEDLVLTSEEHPTHQLEFCHHATYGYGCYMHGLEGWFGLSEADLFDIESWAAAAHSRLRNEREDRQRKALEEEREASE